jgi:N-methylhydantoinase A/oxoprolinase/acetone carboxylase beta subunit
MAYGLGVDTGGTYTDGVIYNFEEDRIVAGAKSLTTKEDLSIGISGVLDNLPQDLLKQVKMVSLSTTLATNACVEGKGSRAALFLLGYDGVLFEKLGQEYGMKVDGDIFILKGCHSQRGELVEEPDWEGLREKVLQLKDRVDAFGIAEYWGIRNPEFEIQAREQIRQWTDLPVVCAHELSSEVNSLRRAATTLLNARLIPLIDELLHAVKRSLEARDIHAPLMIVRGDGSLMTERFARERPVETLLSGPAASVVGGMRLSDQEDGIIIDIGGTTTDMAVARHGVTSLVEDGVDVGEWRTGTRAIQIKTIGLGGDSLISFDKNEQITLGPRKAAPLSWLAKDDPRIVEVLTRIHRENRWHTLSLAEFYYRIRPASEGIELEEEEIRMLEALAEGPLTVEELAERIDSRPYFLRTERLEFLGYIGKSGLTPTDLMHVRGDFTAWSGEAARLGAEILAQRLNFTVEELIDRVFDLAGTRLYALISRFLLERTWKKPAIGLKGQGENLMMMGYYPQGDEIACQMRVNLPLIGIGAPTHIFLPPVAEKLGTRCIISENAGVANAVGAITGSILAEETIVIKPNYEAWGVDGYSCHSSRSYHKTESYEEALEWSRKEARRLVARKAEEMGAQETEIILECNEASGEVGGEKAESILLETVIIARGMGKISQG